MLGEIKKLEISKLVNYFENPRHAIASNEEDTLKKLFEAVGIQYMLNLAEDVQAHGLLGNQQVVVVLDNSSKKYVVYEGNRRVAAIKLLLNPERFSFLDEATIEKAKRIKQNGDVPTKIDCYITDEDEAFFIMERVHSGEDKGRGTKQWTAREKEAFKVRRSEEKSLAYLVDRYTKKYFLGSDITDILPFTTIQRIFNNREVRKLIGLDTSDESSFTKGRIQMVIDASKWIVSVAKTEGVGVTRVFNKARTIEDKLIPWINAYIQANDVDNLAHGRQRDSSSSDDPISNPNGIVSGCEPITEDSSIGTSDPQTYGYNTGTRGESEEPFSSGGSKNLPYFFQGLNYGGLDPDDPDTHGVSAICKELQSFSTKRLVSSYPIASTFLVRSIIEQSIKYYSKKHTIQGQDKLIWENIKDLGKLSQIIQNYKKNLPNYIADATMRQYFTSLFDNYEENVDPLNWVVHRPSEFRLDTNTLIELPKKGLLALINFMIS